MVTMKIKLGLKDIASKKELFYILNNRKYFNFNAIVPEPRYPDPGFDKYKWRTENWGTPVMAKNTKIESDDVISFNSTGYPGKLFEKLSAKYPDEVVTATVYTNTAGSCRPITTSYLNGAVMQ